MLKNVRQQYGQDIPTGWHFACAAVGKLCAACVVYPHEVVRTRLREQGCGPNEQPKYRGAVHALKTIGVEEGIRGLYGGLSAHIIRAVPNTALMFATVATVTKLLNQ